MSVQEYGFGVSNDYFAAGDTGEFAFPCCACRHRFQAQTIFPCNFCGHNENAEESYNCGICGELQKGNPFKDSKTIASGTCAQISYVCLTCYNTIKEDVAER